jgi:hypothetical protein
MASTSNQSVYRATTTAPVNIAVIKYVNPAPHLQVSGSQTWNFNANTYENENENENRLINMN